MRLDLQAAGSRLRGLRPGSAETATPLDTDTREVAQLLADPDFTAAVAELAGSLGRSPEDAMAEAGGCLREMAAWHDPRVVDYWARFSHWMTRGYDVLVDDDKLAELRRLDRKHSLVMLISHRSYLDEFLIPPALNDGGISVYGMAGANLDFFPLGTVARRVGMVHVRRSTTDDPIYRLAMRAHTERLISNRANVLWSIEGGRSRTGKLRPPRYGLLRYVADAAHNEVGSDPLLVPVSIMYDQLPLNEVALMASEARGGVKKPEDARWLLEYARGLRARLGRAYLDFGDPLPLRERMAELRAAEVPERNLVERVALDVCHRLNEATPVTPTAAVCVALLGAGRALTLDQVLETVAPLAGYLRERGWPIAGAATLTDRSTIRWALRELVRSGVLTSYSAGSERVWGIGAEQHLIAAVYRNTAIHVLVERAIAELALLAVADSRADDVPGAGPGEASSVPGAAVSETSVSETSVSETSVSETSVSETSVSETSGPGSGVPETPVAANEALRLRELLKFDFFFAQRDRFLRNIAAEMQILAGRVPVPDALAEPPVPAGPGLEVTPGQAATWLGRARPLVAHLVLRPFLDAYRLVGERLAAAEDEAADTEELVRDCLRLGHQWALQRTLASEESVSGEMFRTALKLAGHRDLLAAGGPDTAKRRHDFADELAEVGRNIDRIAARAGQ